MTGFEAFLRVFRICAVCLAADTRLPALEAGGGDLKISDSLVKSLPDLRVINDERDEHTGVPQSWFQPRVGG